MRRLWSFPGGLHLPGRKLESTRTPIVKAPIPPRLVLPLHQHIGEPAEALVKIGDPVLKGQRIARAKGYVSAPVHAPSSGIVVDVGEFPVPHPSGLNAPCIVIETDGRDRWADRYPVTHIETMDPDELRSRIRAAGIVGLGGAGFPSFIKLNPHTRQSIRTLVLDGAECEPYITCDDMLMRERAAEIVLGIRVMLHAIRAPECLVGIEDNKPEAYQAMRDAVEAAGTACADIEVVKVPTRYPTGGEKQLIYTLTGKEVPADGLPSQVGVVCHNVGTAYAMSRAILHGEPLLSRIVTITGSAVPEPCNLEVMIGTPVDWLLRHCKTDFDGLERLVIGGPMMGYTLQHDDVPIVKTVNCLLTQSKQDLSAPQPVLPCIRCGACARACPVSLLPQQMYWYAKAKAFDKVQDYNLFDCIECGCCAAVCPSHIPLVQFYRFAKTEIYAQEREKKHADQARKRHEFRLERHEREQRERAERMRKKKAALQAKSGGDADTKKKAAIQAALERAKAKRQAAKPKNTEQLTSAQRKQIEEADRRRAESGMGTENAADKQAAPVRPSVPSASKPSAEQSPAQESKRPAQSGAGTGESGIKAGAEATSKASNGDASRPETQAQSSADGAVDTKAGSADDNPTPSP